MFKLSRGSFAIITMVAVALGLSVFAAWFRYEAGNGSLRFWGKDAALRIRSAPQVEVSALKKVADLAENEEPAAIITIQGVRYAVAKPLDLSQARGLIHARHALLEDASLDLAASPPAEPLDWDRLVEFKGAPSGSTTLAIHLDTGWLCRADTGAILKLKEPQRSFTAYIKKLAPRDKDIKEAEAREKEKLKTLENAKR